MSRRLATLPLARAALLFAAVLAEARGGDGPEGDRAAPAAPVSHDADARPHGDAAATVMHARWKLAEEEFCGFLVAKGSDGAFVIATDDGALRTIAHPEELQILSSEEGSVRDVPSLALAHGLADECDKVRDRCEELLRAQKEVALPALGAALDFDCADARKRALELLTRQPAAKLAAPIRRRLVDSDAQVRKWALRAYAVLAPEDLYDRSRWILQHDDAVVVQHEAIIQLGRLHDLHGIDVLFENLEDCDDRSLRLVTFDALRRLTAHDLGRDEEGWRAWWTNHRKEILGSDDPPPPPAPRRKARARTR